MNKLFDSSIPHDHLLRALVAARLVAARRLSPGRDGVAPARCLTLAAAVRVIDRVHRHAAHVRAYAFPTRPPGLAVRDVLMLDVADLAHGRLADYGDAADFARRHTQLRVVALF